jgi:hypothetical protein
MCGETTETRRMLGGYMRYLVDESRRNLRRLESGHDQATRSIRGACGVGYGAPTGQAMPSGQLAAK